MPRISRVGLCCLLTALSLLALVVAPAQAMPDGVPRQDLVLRTSSAATQSRDLYVPGNASADRSSADVLWDRSAKLYEQFSCGPEGSSGLPAIWWSSSPDAVHWSPPAVALRADPGSADWLGACDPSVVKDGAWYYLAFTGYDNQQHAVFVARASTPGGPWATWGPDGWGGGRSTPVVSSSGVRGWGVGHPSLVVADGVLDLFYDEHDGTTWQTRMAQADVAASPDRWPAQVRDRGVVLVHPGADSEDGCAGQSESTGVGYDSDHQRFVAVTTPDRSSAAPDLDVYESDTGLRFTRATTLVAEDAATALLPHAHHLRLLTDEAGHLGSGQYLTYDYGPTDCGGRIRWQDADLYADQTGWVDEPLDYLSGHAHWDMTGRWAQFNHSLWAPVDYAELASARLTTSTVGPTSTVDFDVSLDTRFKTQWAGVTIGGDPGVLDSPHTYRLVVSPYDELSLFRDGALVATAAAVPTPWMDYRHVEVVLSAGTITVYTGRPGAGSMSMPDLRYPMPQGDQPGGDLGLVTRGSAGFKNVTVRDNVPASYRNQDAGEVVDWRQTRGDWQVRAPSTFTEDVRTGGDIFLTDRSDTFGTYDAHLGDGTYRATVRLDPGGRPDSWAGIDLTNAVTADSHSCSWGGYVAYIRRNGAVGLMRPGSGRDLPEVPTAFNPAITPVPMRVVRWGATIQVYLGDDATPAITYTDPSPPPDEGGFGLCTNGTSGEFTDVGYSADGS